MSAEPRYYYVDAQNQAMGPIPFAELLALKTAGTIHDATLVVLEGASEWTAFSTLKPTGAVKAEATSRRTHAEQGPSSAGFRGETEPPWASHLSQKIDQLTAAMEKLVTALEKSRPPAPTQAPATAALHAEKINLNPTPKPGVAALSPTTPGATPRPSSSTPLSPLSVPANAQKSTLPLPTLGTTPAPITPPKGNVFSKFLKK